MRQARVLVNGKFAGILQEITEKKYRFVYDANYQGAPVSLTMPLANPVYEFNEFPPFFEGLLPEGIALEAMLRKFKIDKNDFFGQLLQVGHDLVGAVTIEEMS